MIWVISDIKASLGSIRGSIRVQCKLKIGASGIYRFHCLRLKAVQGFSGGTSYGVSYDLVA